MFYGLTYEVLVNQLAGMQVPTVHADTIFRHAYKFLANRWSDLPGLPKHLPEALDESWPLSIPQATQILESKYDGSVKFLLKMADGDEVEAVLMPEERRLTLCVSSQVGCRQGCTFCHTGKMGLKRNLESHEIVGQVVLANQFIRGRDDWRQKWRVPDDAKVGNIVFMGMGEPLDNCEELVTTINVLSHPLGLNIPLKRISVSTAGHLEGLRTLHQSIPKVPIALSLHATESRKRSRLMPINRRFPFEDVLSYLKDHFESFYPKGFILIQYTLIQGVNDSEEDALRLCSLLEGAPVKVNIIPLNEIDPSLFRNPEPENLVRFRDIVHQAGIRVMIRYSKGQDIAAACGQLVVKESIS